VIYMVGDWVAMRGDAHQYSGDPPPGSVLQVVQAGMDPRVRWSSLDDGWMMYGDQLRPAVPEEVACSQLTQAGVL
jgi:hypothetical protein